MATADITVMGGGIFGLTIAWECCRRGARVRLCERERIGAGSSGGIVGALAPHVPENWNSKKAFQFESLLTAAKFWGEVQEASGIDPGYSRLGRIQPLADEAAVDIARDRAGSASLLWQGEAEWRVTKASPDGWRPASGSGWQVEDTLSARLHPRRASQALAEAVRIAGSTVEEGMTGLPAAPKAEASVSGPVIWATGGQGLAALSDDLGRKVGTVVKGQAALLQCDAGSRPQLFVGGVHIVPHSDGTVAVGSTSERSFDAAESVDDKLDAVVEAARSVCPALADAPIIERWAGVRPRARTRAPMLGGWPGHPGHFVANGGFKIGFGMAPKIASVMADLVLEGQDSIPDGFRVEDSL